MVLVLFLCLALFSSLLFAEDEAHLPLSQEHFAPPLKEDHVLLPELKGVLLLCHPRAVHREGVEGVAGVESEDLDIPGGIETLKQCLEPRFIGRPLTERGLLDLKREVIVYFRDQNHPVVTVHVPEQDVTSGIVQLVVLEGRLGKVSARCNEWFSSARICESIRLCPGDTLTTDTLLSDLAWINRNPFRHTDLVFTPGDQEGVTDIELFVHDRRPFRVYAGGDNLGSEATGRVRLLGGFTWGNAFNLDHVLTYQLTTATDFHRFIGNTIHYTAPLPWRHVLVLFGGWTESKPHLHHFRVRGHGHSAQASLRYTIPLKLSCSAFLQEISLGFDLKNTNNNLEYVATKPTDEIPLITGSVNLSQFVAEYAVGKEYNCHKLNCQIEAYLSPGQLLSHESKKDYTMLQQHATSRYLYGLLTMGDVYTFSNQCSLSALLRVQGSSETLLPSEKFGLGGENSVRGYEEREVNVDNALCANLELRSKPWGALCHFCPSVKDELSLIAFADYGLGNNIHPLHASGQKGVENEHRFHSLLGVGPGMRYRIPPYLSAYADLGFRLLKTQYDDSEWYELYVGIFLSY